MKRLFLFVWIVLLVTSSFVFAGIDEDVQANLTKAKTNRGEIEKAIAYFEKKGDPQQLDAIKFLVANMENQCYVEVALYYEEPKAVEFNLLSYPLDVISALFENLEERGEISFLKRERVEQPFDNLAYPNFSTAEKALDSIAKARNGLEFGRKQRLEDLETVSAEYLIKNVENAFKAWQSRPWAKQIPYEAFREYILPYRGSNEPIEEWREFFIDRYNELAKSMKDSTDPIEAATLINRELTKWYTFDERYYLHPTDLGLAEMRKTGKGRCEDMTNLTIYALRANGICVMSDYTPYWANSGNNHAWNAVLDRSGKAIPFMGCEADPNAYKLSGKIGKAYRKMFSKQSEVLSAKMEKWEKAPDWLSGKYFHDVTSDYADVSDVAVKLEKPLPDSARWAYLCVFNSGEWKPIYWSTIQQNECLFKAMGRDVMYTPMYYVKGKMEPAGEAFLLHKDGKTTRYDGDPKVTQTVKLVSTTRKIIAEATEGKVITALDSGATYELHYWDNGWQKIAEKTADGKTPLVFDNVPQNRLYWLYKKDSNKEEERIFTYENDKQIWW
ncbi:MAG: transglutaminase-like domain-containing protein [bacterium]|nr:transglutaminase-like domain-containing protein [bacterium]